jgi:hypothetical protein
VLPSPISGRTWATQGAGAFGAPREGGRLHAGIDFSAPEGTPVWSVSDGVVERVEAPGTSGFSGYGRIVVVRLPDNVRALYAHLESSSVEVGDQVVEGQQLGTVGATCGTARRNGKPANPGKRCRGPHLHVELLARAYPPPDATPRIDPRGYVMGTPRDSLERWAGLDALIVKLYAKIPENMRDTEIPLYNESTTDDRRPGTIRAMFDLWKEALAFAPAMGGALRVSTLSEWIERYNMLRARFIEAGGSGAPPVANDINRVAEDVDTYIVKPAEAVADAAKGVGSALVIVGIIYLISQARDVSRRYA